MSSARVLVGTRKGAFVLTSDGKRKKWDVSGPHFAGWEIYHVKRHRRRIRIACTRRSRAAGSARSSSDPNDGGKTWAPVGNKFTYDGVPGTHQWYDGTAHPWEFKRVWHLEPSLTDPDTVYAGVEDAALFRSTRRRAELGGALRAARQHGSGPRWQPGAGGMCLHTIILDPRNPESHLHRHLRRRRLSHGRRWQELAPDQPGAQVAVHPRSERGGRPLRAPASRCTRRGPTCCSCRSTGT